MALTLEDLKDRLKQVDEVSLLEKLEIYSDDIVDRFEDKIEEQFEELEQEFNEEQDES